jgi:dephospho-CoA kinase
MDKYKIIGISGTNGSGKDSLGLILAERYGFMFISVADFLREEAKKRGLAIERENLRKISAEWRRKYGLGVLVDMAVEQYKKSGSKYKGLIVSPMRNPGEAQHIKDLGGTLIWLDADPKIRYHRIFKRQRSAEDHKTLEQFLAEEQAEMHSGGDAATLNISEVKAKADISIINNAKSIDEFAAHIEKTLRLE